MGNNSFAPILGSGSAVIAINGKQILIRDCLHVPALRNPLYSLRAHQRQYGCGFIGMQGLGMYVFFPSFIVEVDTATDCHLSYMALGRSTTLSSLDYVQPIRSPHTASATASIPPTAPAVIKDDDDDVPPDLLPTYAPHWPKKPPTPPSTPVDLSLIPPPAYSVRLKDLDRDELIQRLFLVEHAPGNPNTPVKSSPPITLVCMTDDEIVTQLHHPNSCPPPVRPCDTPNSSETKTTYTPEKLHRLT